MDVLKKLFKFFITSFAVVFILLYCTFLFVLPPVFNNSHIVDKVEQIIKEKNNLSINIDNLRLTTYPNLSFKIKTEHLSLLNDNQAHAVNLNNTAIFFNLFGKKLNKIKSDYIYIEPETLKEIFSKTDKKNKSVNLNESFFPNVDVKKIEINNYKSESDYVLISVSNLAGKKNKSNYNLNFEADIKSSKLKNPVYIKSNENIYVSNNALYAKKADIMFGNSKLELDGKITDKNKNSDLKITGKNIPVSDLESSLLYFQKFKKKGKVFIENFYDFSGSIDVNLLYKDGGLYGKCITNELSAKTVLFNVPVKFEKAVFNFENKTIKSDAFGLIGGEKLHSTFELTDLASENRKVEGSVKAQLSDRIADKYIPQTKIKGNAAVSVNYTVKKGIINVNYLLKLNKGSDLYYKNANLGLDDVNRRLFVKTIKTPDKLEITNYDYSIVDNGKITNILLGNGLLLKENEHLALNYITCKTNVYAPVSVTGSFGKYVNGGFFQGDLKYNAKEERVSGKFTVVDSKYKDFYLNKALITADDNVMKIVADGTYDGSEFNWDLAAKNDFRKKIHIYNMDFFLDKLEINVNKSKPKKSNIEIPDSVEDIKIDIDKWKIKMNRISKDRIVLTDILMSGSLKNEVFKFLMPNVKFASGSLSAKGRYDFSDDSASVDFVAKDIDSNIVADVLFNLPEQIHGLASAKFHAQSGKNLSNIKAHADFEVKDGYLLKLGSTEFMIKRSRKLKRPIKIRISDIINVDITKSKALSSDLKGSFDIDNFDMKNVKLTSQQKYLSLLIEGNYDIKDQDANLKLWGKYNKSAEKKVRILFVPLSWIIKIVFRPEKTMDIYKDKIKEVPSVISAPQDQQAFRVKMKGNLNNNNVKVELKRII